MAETAHKEVIEHAAPEAHEETGHGIHISLKAEEIFHIGNFPVTNALLLSTIVLLLLGSAAVAGRKKLAMVPGLLQNVSEFFLESLLELMDTLFGSRAKSEKYLPIIATIFLFVLFSNWFGLLPGVGSFLVLTEHGSAPLLRAPSADLNFTIGLAIVTVIAVNLFGAAAIGTAAHARKFITFKDPISFFIGLIELVSEFARMISFSFRLFGNIFAGEVLLTIVGFLVPYVVPLPFLLLETFVGIVQALIFSMLAIVFIAIAIVDHGDHEEEHHEAVAHSH